MRLALAFLLLVHGVAHLPGLLAGWEWASFPELPFRTTVFGTVEIGVAGARLVGLAWGAMAIGFVALAAALALRLQTAPILLPLALGLSAALCLSAWPKAGYGFVANGVIAALLVAGERYGVI
jgi:hypothetical protein